MTEHIFIAGGAGFIGSHFVDRYLSNPDVRRVTVFDNFSSGKLWHLDHHEGDDRLRIVRGDLLDGDALREAMERHELVVHLASNPDIARAATEPSVDFNQGTILTHQVVEAMRRSDPRRIIYTSGSGVYGDLGETEADEDHGPLAPISTYGASKLAGEGLIAAYCHLFGFSARILRLANVVGPRQTHGVGLDFVRRLIEDGSTLPILGDGRQSKSYIHVTDVTSAAILADEKAGTGYHVFNVATEDYLSVREIADLAVAAVGLEPGSTEFAFSGGRRGWEGDIPVVRMSSRRIRTLGWENARSSKGALVASLRALVDEVRADRH